MINCRRHTENPNNQPFMLKIISSNNLCSQIEKQRENERDRVRLKKEKEREWKKDKKILITTSKSGLMNTV